MSFKKKFMFFRYVYTIKTLHFDNTDIVQLKVITEKNQINIGLTRFPEEQLTKGMKPGDIKCIASLEREISKKQTALFEALDKEIPTGIQQTIREISNELNQAIKTAVKVLRWKLGIASSHDFIRFGSSIAYSFDGINWKICPGQISLRAEFDLPFQALKSAEIESCNRLLEHRIFEPLGHELFCEAWSQRKNNPRSSLVIGIAAAETGFKECLSKLMPQASWLISNIQSPPLKRMLIEYLPTFQAKLGINGKILPPPESVIISLEKGISLRNNVSHGKATEIKHETLDEVLKAVRDLLYLLDFYCGQEWAWKMISYENTVSLIEESKKVV